MKRGHKLLLCAVGFILIGTVALGIGEPLAKKKTGGKVVYKSQRGFSFEYPAEYKIYETLDREKRPPVSHIHIVYEEKDGTIKGPPAMVILVGGYDVSFSIWEDIAWSPFKDVVESFRYNGFKFDPGSIYEESQP